MKLVGIAGSNVGTKTRTAMDFTLNRVQENYPEAFITLIDLAEMNMVFSDGRLYHDYEGDTKYVAETVMEADAIIIGTPMFQASIPATLKNIFDLLPVNAFRDKIVSILATAGTLRHHMVVEQQLKPILSYMKAHIVPTHVFIEEKDFHRKEIINDDIKFRIDRLIEDTINTVNAFSEIRKSKDLEYGF